MALTTDLQLKADGAASIISMVTGYKPEVIEKQNGGALLSFNDTDRPAVTALIEKTMQEAINAPAGDLSLDLVPLLSPLALKYLLPVVIGLLVLGAVGGYFAGSSK